MKPHTVLTFSLLSLPLPIFLYVFCFSGSQLFEGLKNSEFLNRKLRDGKVESSPLFNLSCLGTTQFILNRTICGAAISIGIDENRIYVPQRSNVSVNSLGYSKLDSKNHYTSALLSKVITALPFPVVRWPRLSTKLCPAHRPRKTSTTAHRSHPGLALSHYQVWLDFIFFDHDVIQAVERNETNGIYRSTSWSSISGKYATSENGTLYKNDMPFYDDDIIVVFESDVHITPVGVEDILHSELSAMTTDVLFLGWRNNSVYVDPPVTSFAYALTRRGARLAVKYFDPCAASLDDQIASMIRNHWMTYRAPFRDSNNRTAAPITAGSYAPYGIFKEDSHQ